MGTRGAWGLIKNEETKVTYNHFDSYPDGLGDNVIAFIQDNIQKLDEIFESLILVKESGIITEQHLIHCKEHETINMYVGGGNTIDWYKGLRKAQGSGIHKYGEGLKYMIDSKGFLTDSLFCEWAYIINLDKRVLEIYEGFNKDSDKEGRYADKKSSEENEYYGVSLIAEVPFHRVEDIEWDYESEDFQVKIHD